MRIGSCVKSNLMLATFNGLRRGFGTSPRLPSDVIANRRWFSSAAVILVALLFVSMPSYAGTVYTTPPSLVTDYGAQYRLVFVTAQIYDPQDHNSADYNVGVNTEANSVPWLSSLGATWTVVGSFADGVDAIDNVGPAPGVPIYELSGLFVATDATTNSGGLFSGQIQNPIDINENGDQISPTNVWTGSAPDGTGLSAIGNDPTEFGDSAATGQQWITVGLEQYNDFHPLYVISSELTVPTPEPGALALVAVGLLALVVIRENRPLRL